MSAVAREAALAAADQTTQQIRMHPVVAPCHLAIIGQPLPCAIKLCLADDGGHRRDRNPLGRIHRLRGSHAAAANRQQGRAALLGRACADAVGEDLADVGWVGQHTVQGRRAPGPVSPGRDDPHLVEAPLQGIDRLALVGEPHEQVTHHRSLRLVQANAGGIARPIGIKPVAVGWPCPWQQGAGAQLAQAAAAHALGDQGALILGDGATDLQQELIVRIAAHRAIKERHLGAVLLQLRSYGRTWVMAD